MIAAIVMLTSVTVLLQTWALYRLAERVRRLERHGVPLDVNIRFDGVHGAEPGFIVGTAPRKHDA